MKKIKFSKLVASGNDFVLIDRRKEKFSPGKKNITEICARKFGVGADGVLIIEKSKKCDIKMRILNPDGSEPTMCGNGARCAALYFFLQSKKKEISIQTGAGILTAQSYGSGKVRIKMTDPHSLETGVHIDHEGTKYIINHINTGVPHAVIFTTNLDGFDIQKIGAFVRSHRKFKPEGANVNALEVTDDKNIRIRTYERGVEDETLACGTGAVACATVYGNECPQLSYRKVINVHTLSGERLKVYFTFKNNEFRDVWLEGNAVLVYKGEFNQ